MSDIITELLAIPKFGNGIGLHRMMALCADELTSDWARKVRVFHVVGSNGKGSVAHIIAAVLRALFPKQKIGLYISPHQIRFHERMSINGELISDEDLARGIAQFKVKQARYLAAQPGDTIGAFEAFTAIGINYFYEQATNYLVLEAGIGGRYDSTRVMNGPVTALTSLDLEHTQLLGNSLEAIGYDKLDIAPNGGTVVTGNIDEEQLLTRLRAYADLKRVDLMSTADVAELASFHISAEGMTLSFTVDGIGFHNINSQLAGPHQVSNICTAVACVKKMLDLQNIHLSSEKWVSAVSSALNKISFIGRFQKISEQPLCYIDVAHTPDAIRYLIQTIQLTVAQPILLVTGVSVDKKAEEMVTELSNIAEFVICTRAHHKGTDANIIFDMVPAGIPKIMVPIIDDAMALGFEKAKDEGFTIVVAGGLFLAIEAYAFTTGLPPASLRFF